MLTNLDSELFPNNCEVVQVPSHNQWIYLIQKNGSTTLRTEATIKKWPHFVNEAISSLPIIDVYIRNPRQRYISGLSTYLQHLKRDHPELDPATSQWFATRYNFLNRHFLPQFHWLLNLSRFINPSTLLRFRDFKNFNQLTDYHDTAGVQPASAELYDVLNNKDLELWLYIDQILLELNGSVLTWNELIQHYKKHHNSIFNLMLYPNLDILNQLNVLPKI